MRTIRVIYQGNGDKGHRSHLPLDFEKVLSGSAVDTGSVAKYFSRRETDGYSFAWLSAEIAVLGLSGL